ncbi:hypothetical protein P8452_60161 [Trifolium repens]|nr:hypothetical protein P8452_60161 [Trifolium repens]
MDLMPKFVDIVSDCNLNDAGKSPLDSTTKRGFNSAILIRISSQGVGVSPQWLCLCCYFILCYLLLVMIFNQINFMAAMYPRTIRIPHHVGTKGRMSLNKPIPNVVWKEFQKSQKEKAARAKALSILKKKKKKRSEAKNRKKEQLFVSTSSAQPYYTDLNTGLALENNMKSLGQGV